MMTFIFCFLIFNINVLSGYIKKFRKICACNFLKSAYLNGQTRTGRQRPICHKENTIMKTSARNVFNGTVKEIRPGAVNDEIVLTVEGGQEIVAIITNNSTRKLGLAPGKACIAMIKASTVLVMTDADKYLLSTRNQFDGQVTRVEKGAVNSEVEIRTPAGLTLCAIITNASAAGLGLAPGTPATAIVKAPQVILAVAR